MAFPHLSSALKGKGRLLAPLVHDMLNVERRLVSSSGLRALSTTAAPRNLQTTSSTADSAASSSHAVGAASSSSSSSAAALPSTQGPRVIESRSEALSLLRSQPVHYVVASIAGRTLLLHARDVVSLPRLNDVQVGDVLELDRIHEVGSRDYTLRAQDPVSTRTRGAVALIRQSVPTNNVPAQAQSQLPLSILENLQESQSWAARLRPGGLAHVGAVLDQATVRVRCTVVEHTKGPLEVIVKTKRRKNYKRTIRHKQTYTRLRVEAIQIGQ